MVYYQNKNYKVESIPPEEGEELGVGYLIINLETNQIERREGLLFVALSVAMEADAALEEFKRNEAKKEQHVIAPADGILLPKTH